MRLRYLVVPMLLMLAIFFTAITASGAKNESINHKSHKKPVPESCTAQALRPFSALIWNPRKWERGAPSQNALNAYAKRLGCAPPAHKAAMKHIWRTDKKSFYKYRGEMLWLAKNRSFEYPDGSHWAVPYPIAWCESGGNYYVGPYGAYGLIMEDEWLPPKVQDEIAHRLYVEQGEGPWAPYEQECPYR